MGPNTATNRRRSHPLIKLALVIPTMDRGGAEKQLALLATHLPGDQFDVHVFLLTRGGPRQQDLIDAGVAHTIIGKRFKVDVTAVWRLRKALSEFQPDIVHTWIFAANSIGRFVSLGLKRRGGQPVRIIASERCVDPWKKTWHHMIDRFLVKRSDAMTTNSSGVVAFYSEHGIAPELFRVIANGIEPLPPVGPTDDGSRQRIAGMLDVDPNRKWIVAVGRLWPQKRYRDLIWAAELIGELRRDTTLIIVGDGPQRAELLRHRDAVTSLKRVCFVGQRNDVDQILRHAAAYWIASEYEGQSNGVIEAMQHGVAVIASDIAGNRDLVVDGETGRLVKLGDAADFARQTNVLLEDPAKAERWGRAAAERIERDFSVPKMVDRHIDLYQSLLDD